MGLLSGSATRQPASSIETATVAEGHKPTALETCCLPGRDRQTDTTQQRFAAENHDRPGDQHKFRTVYGPAPAETSQFFTKARQVPYLEPDKSSQNPALYSLCSRLRLGLAFRFCD